MSEDLVHWRHISSCFPAICGSWSESWVVESFDAITCPECLRLRAEWIREQRDEREVKGGEG